ncbi:hypothetical protein Tco_0989913 [Tanacetum coccineum]|uniref:DUF4283 domain-containing protein n=1 Tax=Tanacetum coccineum TaxID=301880 RepID=A0ABQ5EV61_9ASTR
MGTPTQVCVWSCPNFSVPAGRPFRHITKLVGFIEESLEWSGCGRKYFKVKSNKAIPNMVSTWFYVEECVLGLESKGFLYLEMEVMCVEFGCHFEMELECEFHLRWFDDEKIDGLWHIVGKFTLIPLDMLQGFSFFLQMGFTLILDTLDGLDVGLLGDVIDEDDCDDDG